MEPIQRLVWTREAKETGLAAVCSDQSRRSYHLMAVSETKKDGIASVSFSRKGRGWYCVLGYTNETGHRVYRNTSSGEGYALPPGKSRSDVMSRKDKPLIFPTVDEAKVWVNEQIKAVRTSIRI